MRNTITLLNEFQNNTIDFDVLYNYFENYIYNLIFKFNIDLYTNDIFIKLWSLCKNINLSNFTSHQQLDCYIKHTLKRTAINIYNSEKNHNKVDFNSNVINIFSNSHLYSMNFDDSNIIFNDLINNLSKRKKAILFLRYKQGLSDSEIAKKVKLSRQAVYKHRLSALHTIKKSISI